MHTINRRTLLQAFGLVSVSRALPFPVASPRQVAVAQPGENRFHFAAASQAAQSPCKLTSADSGGAATIFEMNALPESGPFLHVHHREDEWYYVLDGQFLFKAGGSEYTLSAGAGIWLPRGVPHVWANTQRSEGKLLLLCQPGGFEHFFDEIGSVPADSKSPQKMKTLMAKYGMDMLGPPLFASSWMRQH